MKIEIDADEHAALVRDAERYRWLRAVEEIDGELSPVQWDVVAQKRYTGELLYGNNLDRVIDAALNQRGGG